MGRYLKKITKKLFFYVVGVSPKLIRAKDNVFVKENTPVAKFKTD